LGITRVWVNREGEKDDPSLADWMIFDLAELPAAVGRL
jgi:FMN phosphatase YigB (HAD superfamily)